MSSTVSLAALLADRARLLGSTTEGMPLTYQQVLSRLGADGVRAAEVARQTGISRQAIGQTIEQMESDGLVTRKPDKTNKRAFIVKTTAKGRRQYDRMVTASADAEARLGEKIGAGRVKALRDALERDWR